MLRPAERLAVIERLERVCRRHRPCSREEAVELLDTILSCGWEWFEPNTAFVLADLDLSLHLAGLGRFTPQSFRARHTRIRANVESHAKLAKGFATSRSVLKVGCGGLGVAFAANLIAGWSVIEGTGGWLLSLAALYVAIVAVYVGARTFMAPYRVRKVESGQFFRNPSAAA